ncbi:hypothetical protein MLD38_021010 [Melastoma candidum]|uniref:Uncharacterized protein n=1 Tax=Melastoma candidum TaxID=119954 RepID=A0ACB9QEX6_9MYRT|nr:hypothetical protein MLD38_021010 [Melastoma candidum]
MLEQKERFISLWVVSIFSGLFWLLGILYVVAVFRPGSDDPPSASLYFFSIMGYPHALGTLVGVFLSSFTIMCIFTGGVPVSGRGAVREARVPPLLLADLFPLPPRVAAFAAPSPEPHQGQRGEDEAAGVPALDGDGSRRVLLPQHELEQGPHRFLWHVTEHGRWDPLLIREDPRAGLLTARQGGRVLLVVHVGKIGGVLPGVRDSGDSPGEDRDRFRRGVRVRAAGRGHVRVWQRGGFSP